MECNRMSGDSVVLLVILLVFCVSDAYQMAPHQPTKLMKTKNIDIVLRCLLLDKHERFNQNASVTWWFKKTCRSSCWNAVDEDDWTEISCNQGACGFGLSLNDETASNGFYLCKMFPYQIGEEILQVEVTKAFEVVIVDPISAPPPELLNDTPNKYFLPANSQWGSVVLQCKCRSSQKPTIKWFRKKEENLLNDDDHSLSYNNFIESSRSIKYFESFYEPLVSSGLKELTENLYLSKLIVNNITRSQVFVCVAINYFGFSYRESVIDVQTTASEVLEEDVLAYQEKNYEILILIPIVLLMPSSVLMCTLFYLLINRQIMRSNKTIEIV